MSSRLLGILLGVALCDGAALAATFSGQLDDPGNAALVGSDLGSALFGDDFEIANNVALYALSISAAGTFTFESTGFGMGGIDPYFTLFEGTGSSATFLASNYDQAFSTGGDFSLPLALSAGDYVLAIGAFANMSFAENLGLGSLGDGFVALGQPGLLGTYYYELHLEPPVPEPSALLMWALGLAAAARRQAGGRNTTSS